MKTFLIPTLLTLLIITFSCKSLDNLVDDGKYDEAISLATQKLADDSNKKTNDIKALEDAFSKANTLDLDQLDKMKSAAQSDASAWIQVYDYAEKIEKRQQLIEPLLPLISKDNYTGRFMLIETKPLLSQSKDGAASYLYNQGITLLNAAKASGDKVKAHEAHNYFSKIDNYRTEYKNVNYLLAESKAEGTTHFLIEIEDHEFQRNVSEAINNRKSALEDDWTVYHTTEQIGVEYDQVSKLTITDVVISPEKEESRTYAESRNVPKAYASIDTLGNSTQETELAEAFITETTRLKYVSVNAELLLKSKVNSHGKKQENFTHVVDYKKESYDITGDSRAVANLQGWNDYQTTDVEPFPSDLDLVNEAMENIAKHIISYLKK